MDEANIPVWMERESGDIEKFSFTRYMLDQEHDGWRDVFLSLED